MSDTTRQHIEEHGWSVLGITPRVGDPGDVFTYTIGLLDTFQHPEVLVSGPSRGVAVGILNAIGDLIRGGRRFGPEDVSDEVLETVPVQFTLLPVDYYFEELGSLQRWRGARDFPALQCVLPDKNAVYPWAGGEPSRQQVREDWWWGVARSASGGPLWDSARWAVASSLAATCRQFDLDPVAYARTAATRRGIELSGRFSAAQEEVHAKARGQTPAEQFEATHSILPAFVDALNADPDPELMQLLARHIEMRRAGTL